MQIHEYLTDVPQIGRRDYRVYPHRYADPYYVPPPPGNHRGKLFLEWEEEEEGEV